MRAREKIRGVKAVARYADLKRQIDRLEKQVAEQGDTSETRQELKRLMAEIHEARRELKGE